MFLVHVGLSWVACSPVEVELSWIASGAPEVLEALLAVGFFRGSACEVLSWNSHGSSWSGFFCVGVCSKLTSGPCPCARLVVPGEVRLL